MRYKVNVATTQLEFSIKIFCIATRVQHELDESISYRPINKKTKKNFRLI